MSHQETGTLQFDSSVVPLGWERSPETQWRNVVSITISQDGPNSRYLKCRNRGFLYWLTMITFLLYFVECWRSGSTITSAYLSALKTKHLQPCSVFDISIVYYIMAGPGRR
jgi:hypothetical protein